MYLPLHRLLLVEPDRQDARLVRMQLAGESRYRAEVDWVRSLQAGLERLRRCDYHALLLAERAVEGVADIHRVVAMAPDLPVVVLMEEDDPARAGEYLHAGVQEVLPKAQQSGPMLVRVLQYAKERKRTERLLRTGQMVLEARIEDRTRHLKRLNERLQEEIRQREAVERALRRETDFIATVLDTVSALVAVLDAEGRVRDVNRALERLCGDPRQALRGQPAWRCLAPPGEAETLRRFVQRALAGERVGALELPLTDGDDSRLVRWESALLRDEEGGAPRHLVLCGSDVTEQHRAKERERRRLLELAQAARLSTMGEMAAEIAHELNQPLSAIANYARAGRLMLQRDGDRAALARVLDEIQGQAQRAGEVIRRLRQFVGKAEMTRVPCEVNALVEDVRRLIEIEARWNHVRLELHLADDLPKVFADRILVEQVILNLARNAIEAMTEVPEARRRLHLRTAGPEDGMIRIEVIDTGPGMDERQIRQIFDRFYTTKRHGMGIGLAICRSIAESHGGRLEVFARPGQGARFALLLPEWRDE